MSRNWLSLSAAFFLLTLNLPAVADTARPVVHMQTSMGEIVLELDAAKAPRSVENFIRYVREGFYDGTIYHRVIDGFMIQGGGFSQDYQRKDTHEPIGNEADNGLLNKRGTIAMARTNDPHSATAQFFINIADNRFLNHSSQTPRGWGYTVFGQVINGMDTVDRIRRTPTGAGGPFPKDVPATAIVIEKVTVEQVNINPSEKPL
ncbi:MAG: peptidyl-prolyl cis-trans isomerase [Gammaproteobacteria bacterium]|nr:peptidyl-prolyl cis-trans isomerase [Gammaproteobacteria bacterium]